MTPAPRARGADRATVGQRGAAARAAAGGIPPATPTASPTPISRRTRSSTSVNDASESVANSIIPIISAIPTGSLNPDSPSRIVPDRPRSPAAEDGERHRRVGRSQCGADQESEVQSRPSTQWAATRDERSGGNVPTTPRTRSGRPPCGTAAARCRCRRRTGSRSARASRSADLHEREHVPERSDISEATAATVRSSAAAGRPIRRGETRTRIAIEERQRDDEDDPAEVDGVRHARILPVPARAGGAG